MKQFESIVAKQSYISKRWRLKPVEAGVVSSFALGLATCADEITYRGRQLASECPLRKGPSDGDAERIVFSSSLETAIVACSVSRGMFRREEADTLLPIILHSCSRFCCGTLFGAALNHNVMLKVYISFFVGPTHPCRSKTWVSEGADTLHHLCRLAD